MAGVVLHSPLYSGVRVLQPNLKCWPGWLDIFPNQVNVVVAVVLLVVVAVVWGWVGCEPIATQLCAHAGSMTLQTLHPRHALVPGALPAAAGAADSRACAGAARDCRRGAHSRAFTPGRLSNLSPAALCSDSSQTLSAP